MKLARGEAQGRPHGAIFWRSGHYRTMLADDWKLQVSERPAKTWLFDLERRSRPSSATSPASAPTRCASSRRSSPSTRQQMVAPAWPALIEGPIAIDHPLERRAAGPSDEFVYWAN